MYFSFKATEGQPISLTEVTNRPVNLPKQQHLPTNHIPCLQEVRPIIFLFFKVTAVQPISLAEATSRPVNLPKQHHLATRHLTNNQYRQCASIIKHIGTVSTKHYLIAVD